MITKKLEDKRMYSYSGNSSVAYPHRETITGTCRCAEYYGTDVPHYFSPNRCGTCCGTKGSSRVEYFNEIHESSSPEDMRELYVSTQDFLARGGKRRSRSGGRSRSDGRSSRKSGRSSRKSRGGGAKISRSDRRTNRRAQQKAIKDKEDQAVKEKSKFELANQLLLKLQGNVDKYKNNSSKNKQTIEKMNKELAKLIAQAKDVEKAALVRAETAKQLLEMQEKEKAALELEKQKLEKEASEAKDAEAKQAIQDELTKVRSLLATEKAKSKQAALALADALAAKADATAATATAIAAAAKSDTEAQAALAAKAAQTT